MSLLPHAYGYLITLSHNIFTLEPLLGPHISEFLHLDFKAIYYCPHPAWLNFTLEGLNTQIPSI